MRLIKSLLITCFVITALSSQAQSRTIDNSLGKVKLEFILDEKGNARYAVYHNQKPDASDSRSEDLIINKSL